MGLFNRNTNQTAELDRVGYEQAVREAELQAENERVRNIQQENMLVNQEKSMVSEQLDLSEEIERLDYLLRGYVQERNKDSGEMEWIAPKDQDFVILSDYGVHLIRNTVAWYLNKNTLLSNYDDKIILSKMEDFASDLNDTIFMEYEKVFQFPSFEDCRKIFEARIENKVKLRVFAKELIGQKVSEEERKKIEEEIVKNVELTVEKELENIKQQVMKNKRKRFMIIMRSVQDLVHSTYNRAMFGAERRTLREHIHISESKGMPMMQTPKGGVLDFLRR